ncbi:MAG: ComEC/Rec2 family competence protein [Chthoniobacterales bacterium]|nr:ComEC/Rec2 family competence protein [Chthoniobacterales bacterium]
MTNPAAPSRLPLAGMALSAVAGILIADRFAPEPLLAAGISAAALLRMLWRGGWISPVLATAGAFAAVHAWQWQDAPARLWADAAAPNSARVTGVLLDEPVQTGNAWRSRMRTEEWNLDTQTFAMEQTIMVRWRGEDIPRYGDRWTVEGVVERPRAPRNPGAFDAAAWLARQGVFLELRSRYPQDSRLLARDRGSSIKAAALATRDWIMRTLGLGLEQDPGIRAVIAGITLGARDDGADEFVPAFRQTGTLHLFAVSGLHVGMFGLLLWFVLRPLGLNRHQAILVIIPLLFFYSLVTGAKPSSLRAATMIAIALGGFLLDRAPAAGNSLAAAALVLLGIDTNQLFQPGFQLSFCVVASIILLAQPLDRWLAVRLRPDPFIPQKLFTRWQRSQASSGRMAAAALAVSTSSWVGSLPLTIMLFHLVPLLAVPVNLLAVPVAFAILSVSMLAIVGGLFSTWLAAVFNHTNWGLASALLAGVQWTAALPGAWFHMPPGWMQPPARLTVFDLATGGAQLLRTPHKAWLIDSGTAYDFARIIEPALRSAGVGRLDGLILTHGDNEHVGGAPGVLASNPPRRVLDSVLRDRSPARKAVHDLLRARSQPKWLILPGDRVTLGDGSSLVLLTPSPAQKARVSDDQAVAIRIDTNGFRVLLMSDAGLATEQHLLEFRARDLRADILVLGRHGDDIFATSEFLEAVRPRAIIVAAADPFRDGSGEPALRGRLDATGAEIFDQQQCGAVIATFHAAGAELKGFITGQHAELVPLPD